MSRNWYPAKVEYKRGTYWNVRASDGRGKKVNLSLGYVTEEAARRAAELMTQAEADGRAAQIRELHAQDREKAILLLTDSSVDIAVEVQPDFGRMSVREYFDAEFASWRAAKVPASWRTEERRWEKIIAGIGDVELRDVDAHVVADYLDGLVSKRGPRTGQPLSGNTRRLYRASIKAMLHRAFRLRHIAALPDLGVFRIEGSTRRVQKKPAPLTIEEVVTLMDASAPKHRAMWAVGAGQGLRPSELVRIRWEDVDLERRTLAVRGTKTEASEAVIPLTGLARRELSVWMEGRDPFGLVFPSESGGMYADQGYRKALKTAARAAGIARRVYPYLLRDSFATIAWQLGVDMDIARRILRHTDDTMLREVYCRPRPEDIASFVEAFDYA